MTKEEQIRKLQKDGEQCSRLIRTLVLNEGVAPNHIVIWRLEDRIWYVTLQIYLLTEKNERRKARTLRSIGLHQN